MTNLFFPFTTLVYTLSVRASDRQCWGLGALGPRGLGALGPPGRYCITTELTRVLKLMDRRHKGMGHGVRGIGETDKLMRPPRNKLFYENDKHIDYDSTSLCGKGPAH